MSRQIVFQVENGWSGLILCQAADALAQGGSAIDSPGARVFDDQADRIEGGEGFEVGVKQDVDALAVKRSSYEEEGEGRGLHLVTPRCSRLRREDIRGSVRVEGIDVHSQRDDLQLLLGNAAGEVDLFDILAVAPDLTHRFLNGFYPARRKVAILPGLHEHEVALRRSFQPRRVEVADMDLGRARERSEGALCQRRESRIDLRREM